MSSDTDNHEYQRFRRLSGWLSVAIGLRRRKSKENSKSEETTDISC